MIADTVTFILILIVNVFVASMTCKYSAEQEIAMRWQFWVRWLRKHQGGPGSQALPCPNTFMVITFFTIASIFTDPRTYTVRRSPAIPRTSTVLRTFRVHHSTNLIVIVRLWHIITSFQSSSYKSCWGSVRPVLSYENKLQIPFQIHCVLLSMLSVSSHHLSALDCWLLGRHVTWLWVMIHHTTAISWGAQEGWTRNLDWSLVASLCFRSPGWFFFARNCSL